MTERLADIVTHIQNVRQLEAVVTAMRGIAASRAQKARSQRSAVEAYTDVISYAIGQALTLLPESVTAPPSDRKGKRGVILFCAEQGFAGAFSEHVFEAAGDIADATSFVIGTRGSVVAGERGVIPTWSTAMPTHVEAIPGFANRVADALYSQMIAGATTRIDLFYSRSLPGGGLHVDRHSLLPIDFGRFAKPVESQPPLTTLPPAYLLEQLTAEYVFAQICEAAMHAFEAENEARMMAMASAKSNIETKLTALQQRERQLRQEEITTEIVELAAGTEALTEHRR